MKSISRPWIAAVCLLSAAAPGIAQAKPSNRAPGVTHGVTLLPNGWKIAPAGRHMNVGDLPLAMVESSDGRYLVVTGNGYVKPSLAVVDLKNFNIKQKLSVENA